MELRIEMLKDLAHWERKGKEDDRGYIQEEGVEGLRRYIHGGLLGDLGRMGSSLKDFHRRIDETSVDENFQRFWKRWIHE